MTFTIFLNELYYNYQTNGGSMRVGDLVEYKRKRKDNRFSYKVGVVVGNCPIIELDDWYVVEWTCGARFSENRRFLKLVKN